MAAHASLYTPEPVVIFDELGTWIDFPTTHRVVAIAPGNRTSTHCAEPRLNTQTAVKPLPAVNLSHSQVQAPRQALTSAPPGAKNQYIQQNRQFPQPNTAKNWANTRPFHSQIPPQFAKITAHFSLFSESHGFFTGFSPRRQPCGSFHPPGSRFPNPPSAQLPDLAHAQTSRTAPSPRQPRTAAARQQLRHICRRTLTRVPRASFRPRLAHQPPP